jgi:hypothetical protein
MARASRAYLSGAIVFLALTAPAVPAQDRGVIIDPDSPAGTEYAIPLEQARRDAAGADAVPPSGGAGEPLFGAGITPARQARAADAGGDGRGSRPSTGAGAGAGRDETPNADSESGTNGPSGSTAAVAAAAGDGGSNTVLSVGIAAAVLAVGLVAGLAFRRTLGNS